MPSRGAWALILGLAGAGTALAVGVAVAMSQKTSSSSGPSVYVNGQQGSVTIESPAGINFDATGPPGDQVRIVYSGAPSPNTGNLYSCAGVGYCGPCTGAFDASGKFHACDTVAETTSPLFYVGVQDLTTGVYGNWGAVNMTPAG